MKGLCVKINENEFIWVEKYRPQKISDIVMPKSIKDIFLEYITQSKVPNLLLTSNSAGLGKTSIAKILVNETKGDLLFLNGNLDTGIDVMRSRVIDFCSSVSIDDNPKFLLIDECLEENEKIKTPSGSIALKDIQDGEFIDCYSLNRETGEIELDKASVISSKEEEIFEVTMEDGRKIKVTDNHPFICKNKQGYYVKSIKDGLNEKDEIVDFFEIENISNKQILEKIETFLPKESLETLKEFHPNIDFVIRVAIEEYIKRIKRG